MALLKVVTTEQVKTRFGFTPGKITVTWNGAKIEAPMHYARYATATTGKTGRPTKQATVWEQLGNALGAQPAAYNDPKISLSPKFVVTCATCGKRKTAIKDVTLTRSGVYCAKCYDTDKHGDPTNRTRDHAEIAAAEDAHDEYLRCMGWEHHAERSMRSLGYVNGYPNQGFEVSLPMTQIRHGETIRWRAEQARAAKEAAKQPTKPTRKRKAAAV